MKYFLDTEFIEGFHKPIFGKNRHYIDLISIGIVAEDGREYYAISNEFNPKDIYDTTDANEAIRVMVLERIVYDWVMSYHGDGRNYALDRTEKLSLSKQIRVVQAHIGKSISTIHYETKKFCGGSDIEMFAEKNIEFYGYYADYDWVLFCSLFGRMIDLPKGFPMYCKDLKQQLDEYASTYEDHFMNGNETFEWRLSAIKNKDHYPKEYNEHNALADAKWNKRLHEFLQTGDK